MKNRSITKDFILVVFVVVFSKILGFGRELVISYLYGASVTTDAFYFVNGLITAFFSIITMGLAQAFMPLYTDLMIRGEKEKAKHFADKIITILMLVSFLFSAVVCVFPKFFISLLGPDLTEETKTMSISMLTILTWCIPIYTIFSIRKCILNANKKYIVTEASGIPYSICIVIFSIVFYKISGNLALPIAAIIGVFSQFLFTFLFSRKNYLFSFNFHYKEDSLIKDYFLIMLPIAISVLLEETNGLVRKSLAGGLGEGAIANLNYCMTLTTLVNGIVITSITTVYFPHMIETYSQKDYELFKKHINNCLSLSSFVLFPIVGFLAVCSKEVVQIVYERGAFSADDTNTVSSLFSIYIIGSVFLLYRNVIKTAFFSAKDSKIPMINEIIYLLICITTNVLQVKVFHQGLDSLGISWVLAIVLMTPLLFVQFRKKYFSVFDKNTAKEIIKISLSIIPFVLLLFFCRNYISTGNKYLNIFIYFALSMVLYFIPLIIFKSDNMNKICSSIFQLFKRKKKR